MSDLQTNAKPFLVPLLEGQKIRLLRKGKTAIASWATMMVMVSEHMEKDPEMVAVSQRDRSWMLQNHKPPSSRWRIWIGQHRRQNHDLLVHSVAPLGTDKEVERFGPEGLAYPNAQTTTICLGKHLVIHVMSSQHPWPFMRAWKLPTRVSHIMAEIWPVRSGAVDWPTSPRALNDNGLELLCMEWFNELRFITQSEGRSS
jgi:hypothetical protein